MDTYLNSGDPAGRLALCSFYTRYFRNNRSNGQQLSGKQVQEEMFFMFVLLPTILTATTLALRIFH
jgi:hypothetical protein